MNMVMRDPVIFYVKKGVHEYLVKPVKYVMVTADERLIVVKVFANVNVCQM